MSHSLKATSPSWLRSRPLCVFVTEQTADGCEQNQRDVRRPNKCCLEGAAPGSWTYWSSLRRWGAAAVSPSAAPEPHWDQPSAPSSPAAPSAAGSSLQSGRLETQLRHRRHAGKTKGRRNAEAHLSGAGRRRRCETHRKRIWAQSSDSTGPGRPSCTFRERTLLSWDHVAGVAAVTVWTRSPLFLCRHLVWLSESSPGQLACVPAQHAVTQSLQVAASGGSYT